MGYCTQILNGLNLDCEKSFGGIRRVFLANYADVTSIEKDTDGFINSISMAGNAKFKEYECVKNTGSMVSNLTINETAGSNFVTTELNLVFVKQDAIKQQEMEKLQNAHLVCVVEDANSNWWYLGADNYVYASGGCANSGVNLTDANSFSITLTDISAEYPYWVTQGVINQVIGTPAG